MSDAIWIPHIQKVRCTGCGACVAQCPTAALALQNGKAVVIAPDQCVYCAVCEEICPAAAIQLPYLVVINKKQ